MNKFLTFYSKRAFPFILFVFAAVYAFGHGGKTHMAQMCDMLFSFEFGQNENLYDAKFDEFKRRISEKEFKKIEMLNSAAYLAIDFFNGGNTNTGKADFKFLQNAHIRNLPASLSEIDYPDGSLHQRYTHRGWNFRYPDDKAHWKKRQAILLNTAAKVFDQSPNSTRIDAFCALIYYCHILGDHEHDKQKNSTTRMALGGIEGDYTILNELSKNVIPFLFNQKGAQLSKDLLEINTQVQNLLSKKPGIDNNPRRVNELSDNEYLEYQKYATQTLKLLQKQVPSLLKQQAWFTEAFPSAKKL